MSHRDRFSHILPALLLAGLAPLSSAQSIWFVDASSQGGNGESWSQAFSSLQSAFDVGIEGDQVWVAAGVYRPTKELNHGHPRSATFALDQRISLFGGFQGSETSIDERDPALFERTVLSGDIGVPGDPSDNAYHVIKMGSFQSGATLLPQVNGFRITGGRADGKGGGLLIGLDGMGWSPVLMLSDCLFDDNAAVEGGAIATIDFGLLYLKRCRIEGNSATSKGGAVFSRTGSLHAANSTFTDNASGGRGGALWATSVGMDMITYSNCLFARNSAALSGGAVHLSGSDFVSGRGSWSNCTFAANHAGTMGGAIHINTNANIVGHADLFNTVVWGNEAPSGPQISGQGQTVLYCDVEGGYAGTGNIDADPLFRAVPGAEYEPRPGSPVNDAGDNSLIVVDRLDLDDDGVWNEETPFDLNGLARRIDDPLAPDAGNKEPAVDMGAFELSVFRRAN